MKDDFPAPWPKFVPPGPGRVLTIFCPPGDSHDRLFSMLGCSDEEALRITIKDEGYVFNRFFVPWSMMLPSGCKVEVTHDEYPQYDENGEKVVYSLPARGTLLTFTYPARHGYWRVQKLLGFQDSDVARIKLDEESSLMVFNRFFVGPEIDLLDEIEIVCDHDLSSGLERETNDDGSPRAVGGKDTNPKDAVGIRKWRQLSVVPFTVIWEVAVGILEGARKYGRHNYRVSKVRASVYVDAAMAGHLMPWWEGEDIDEESGINNITKAICSLVVLRDAMIQDQWVDDRPPKTDMGPLKERLQNAVDEIFERHPVAVDAYLEGDQHGDS